MTDKTLEKIKSTASESVDGLKRHGVKSLGEGVFNMKRYKSLAKPSVPIRLNCDTDLTYC
jgi:hypothetical protein